MNNVWLWFEVRGSILVEGIFSPKPNAPMDTVDDNGDKSCLGS